MIVGTFGVLMSVAIGYLIGRKEEHTLSIKETRYWKNKYEHLKNDIKESKNDDKE